MDFLGTLKSRLTDRGTFLGLFGLLSTIGVSLAPGVQESYIAIGLAVGGLIAVFWPDDLNGQDYSVYLQNIFRERSTWGGVLAVVAGIGMLTGMFSIGVDLSGEIATAGAGIASVVWMLFNQRNIKADPHVTITTS